MKELKVAKKAAKKAGKLCLDYFGGEFEVTKKGEIDLVTEVDLKCQAEIIRVIRKEFPDDAILAEEGDFSKTAKATRRWIIDPIDGTTNFSQGYPMFCVSIAFEEDGVVKAGAVYAPVLKEMFTAEKNKGAFLNKKPIQVSKTSNLKDSVLVTGFPYELKDPLKDNLPLFSHLIYRTRAIRRDGTAALNLCYTACGRFTGFWELGLSPWDVAAGVLILREAGGELISLDEGSSSDLPTALIGGNPQICRNIYSEIGPLRAAPAASAQKH